MRLLKLFPLVLFAIFLALPAAALECANAGATPNITPEDNGDGDAIACGSGAVAGGNDSTALGYAASSPGNDSIALGRSSSSGGEQSTALGYVASTEGDFSTALSYYASSDGFASIALGPVASSAGISSTALGHLASSVGDYSTALGYRAYAEHPDTVIIGSIAGVNVAGTYAKVGIGTTNPVEAVDVQRSGAAARFQLTSFTAAADQAPQFIQRRARGTTLAPTAVLNSDNLGLFSFRGHNGTVMGGSRATITAQAAGDFTVSSTPTRLIFATTPVGQSTPQQVLVITPDGKVQVNGQNLIVPDYVFEDDYALMPLDELQAFIDDNGHLPGIPSAAQVNVEGHDLAGSDMAHLRKIEELTLYTLQQEQRLKELQAKADKVDRLEALINLLMQERDKS
jgi:hypothetical protein